MKNIALSPGGILARRARTGIPMILLCISLATPALAAETVTVTLTNKADTAMPTNDGLGMGGNPKTAAMTVTAQPATLLHGPVTFKVSNASPDLVHEMLVVKVADTSKPLPYDRAAMELNEDQLGSLGEVSELPPGSGGTLTLDLGPGTYALICNQPGHYAAGMWTLLTVK